MREGGFVYAAPLHADFLPPHEAEKIGLLLRLNYATMRLLRLTCEERNRCLVFLLFYFWLHRPDFSELNSLAVLR